MVEPRPNATSNPNIPPMCTRGTHSIETAGTGSTDGAKDATRGPMAPCVSGTTLGVPVVPLVKSTTASSPGAGSLVLAPSPGGAVNRAAGPSTGSRPDAAAAAA